MFTLLFTLGVLKQTEPGPGIVPDYIRVPQAFTGKDGPVCQRVLLRI